MSPPHSHKVFTIKAGDRLPALEILLKDCNGEPLDLTPYQDVLLVIASCVGGRRIVDMEEMEKMVPLTEGRVVYEWPAGQTDKAGEYQLEVILSPDFNINPESEQKLMTLPGGGYGKVVITPRL